MVVAGCFHTGIYVLVHFSCDKKARMAFLRSISMILAYGREWKKFSFYIFPGSKAVSNYLMEFLYIRSFCFRKMISPFYEEHRIQFFSRRKAVGRKEVIWRKKEFYFKV